MRPCCGPADLDRRAFLRMVGAGTLALAGAELPLMAGPFDNPNFDVNIPADKKLQPDWVQSLYDRGTPEIFRGDQLKTIRMPVGGVGAGHVYLSGEGRLTHFIVNDHLMNPAQGFALKTETGGQADTRQLNQHDFPGVTFRGEYPIAKVEYTDANFPVQTSLEVFSPFVPLDADASGKPATIFNFTLKNTSETEVTATLAGALENGVCRYSKNAVVANLRNQIVRDHDLTTVNFSAEPPPEDANAAPNRPDVVFEDWSKDTYDGWTVEGTVFGSGPMKRAVIEKEAKELGGDSPGVVNSYYPTHSNAGMGKLTSSPFTIQRKFINIWIGGGNLAGKTCVNLVVDGKVVDSQTGAHENRHTIHFFDARAFQDKQATLEIVDQSKDDFGQISVGKITFSDIAGDGTPLEKLQDFGTMALALVGPPAELALAQGSVGFDGTPSDDATVPISQSLIGTLGRKVQLAPGDSATITFVVAWHFPNLNLKKLGDVGRYYAKKYDSAQAVAKDVAANAAQSAISTRQWRDVWYDSTLPYWFLDRTLLNVSTLATSGCYRFADGRFYAWEGGPDCCPGTCTHVWQYAHSMGRIFPELERDTRERVDLGLAMNPATGVIGFRAEFDSKLAVDGQAGTLLRIYREHQMTADDAFLKRNWDKIKKAYDPLFGLDSNEDGILEGSQMNTLDRPWFGQIAWMSSLYLAALRAGEQMAHEMNDDAFAQRCDKIAAAGMQNIPARLFNGEYFYNIIDPAHKDSVNSGDGSYIDQVYGQSWAFQVGLPRVLPEKETRTALRSMWTYNFSPDAGAYFTAHKSGRRFVTAGDAGMIMCTFPRTDWDYTKASGGNPEHAGFAYYFNETWTGNEYQVASHMIWEGMLLEGMAMVRAIHDRYNPTKRNPFSEIECGDHYARAMASHGAYIALCGFEYHGPLGTIAFAPRLTPEKFRAPFTAAEGWGTFAQTIDGGRLNASLEVKSGQLRLTKVTLAPTSLSTSPRVNATLATANVAANVTVVDGRAQIEFNSDVIIPAGKTLQIEIA